MLNLFFFLFVPRHFFLIWSSLLAESLLDLKNKILLSKYLAFYWADISHIFSFISMSRFSSGILADLVYLFLLHGRSYVLPAPLMDHQILFHLLERLLRLWTLLFPSINTSYFLLLPHDHPNEFSFLLVFFSQLTEISFPLFAHSCFVILEMVGFLSRGAYSKASFG